MITPQIFALSSFLLIGIGIYLAFTITEYQRVRHLRSRRRGEIVSAFRKVVVAFCWFMLPMSFFVRTGFVLLGYGDVVTGQVVFFALAGTNVAGVIYVLVSLKFD